MYTNLDQQLDELLRTSIESLDISDTEYRLAASRYQAVSQFLADYWGDSRVGGEVYPQGSMRLGTVTRNIHRDDEIDIDLVARRDLQRTLITQAALKADTGHGLDLFVKSSPEGLPSSEEGKRCWTLVYPGFHLDVLPALPDEEDGGTGIFITDTGRRPWLPSNPIGYADWFHAVMRTEWLEKRAVLVEKTMNVDDVPEWAVKTTLQRTVQALKRHRDIYFINELADRPASVIITTLAAKAYRGGGSLYEVLLDVTASMPTLIEQQNGAYVVSNPVQAKENFADHWKDQPHHAQRFLEWAERAQLDFAGIGSERGVDSVLKKMAGVFGERAAERAGRTAGTSLLESRRSGQLAMAAGTGALVTGARHTVRPQVNVHDFMDKNLGKAIPYGIYDLSANTGWVSVGTDHDTSAFAVATLRTWWNTIGKARYPDAGQLLICADGGGSNGYRVRAWKIELAKLAAETGLEITVCHLPPGTSKWNKIEHRLFSQITMNWRGRPLRTHQIIVDLISSTTTATGLTVHCVMDTSDYPTGIKYIKKDVQRLPITYHDFHAEWNYTVMPDDTP